MVNILYVGTSLTLLKKKKQPNIHYAYTECSIAKRISRLPKLFNLHGSSVSRTVCTLPLTFTIVFPPCLPCVRSASWLQLIFGFHVLRARKFGKSLEFCMKNVHEPYLKFSLWFLAQTKKLEFFISVM